MSNLNSVIIEGTISLVNENSVQLKNDKVTVGLIIPASFGSIYKNNDVVRIVGYLKTYDDLIYIYVEHLEIVYSTKIMGNE